MDDEPYQDATCLQCGACCHVDMIAYITDEDIERWEREGRQDIIAHFRDHEVMWAGDRIISKYGGRVTTCHYLDWRGDRFFCEIYETRPRVCRSYVPGSSGLCPQHRGRAEDRPATTALRREAR